MECNFKRRHYNYRVCTSERMNVRHLCVRVFSRASARCFHMNAIHLNRIITDDLFIILTPLAHIARSFFSVIRLCFVFLRYCMHSTVRKKERYAVCKSKRQDVVRDVNRSPER